MKAASKILFFALLVAAVLTMTVFFVAADNNKPFLPGVTVTDEHPNGCVDCHKVSGSNDYRLNVSLAEIEGHPKIDAIVKNLPQDCMMCHKAGTTAGPLSDIAHRNHYSNPANNAFITTYKGACLNCHSINPGSGKMALKSGPKNW